MKTDLTLLTSSNLTFVMSKRGLFDFLVVCDETNNTPDVIDNNEFKDIYLKPAKSINYVTLTFVHCHRTGAAFEEVVGYCLIITKLN